MSNSKVGFFSVLKGTFTRLDIYPKLLNNSWWRTFLYLIIFIIILGSAVGFMQYRRMKPTINAFKIMLIENFGSHIISDINNKFIYPVDNPEKSRQVSFQNLCALYYPGKTGIKDIPVLTPKFFAIWHPQYLILGTKNSDDNVISRKFYFGTQNRLNQKEIFSNSLASLLKANSNVDFTKLAKAENNKTVFKMHFDIITNIITQTIIIVFIGNNIFMMLIHVLLLTAVFSFMYNISARSKNLNVTGLKVWKLGIYASFPVLFVAAAFPALNLPLLSFDTVYMFGLVIYWLKIIFYTERTISEEKSSDDNIN